MATIMEQIEKNTVSSKGQLEPSKLVDFPTEQNNGIHVLFLGNSITRHGPCPSIGWNFDWGMAASDISLDYVHCLMKKIAKKRIEACYCIAHAGDWERQYAAEEPFSLSCFERAREVAADVIVWRLLENCSCVNFNGPLYEERCKELLDYVNPKGSARVIMTTSFWKHPGDFASRNVADERGYPIVELGQYGEQDEMKALGLFAHEGVANHPGDRGMQAIADEIWKPMEPMLDAILAERTLSGLAL